MPAGMVLFVKTGTKIDKMKILTKDIESLKLKPIYFFTSKSAAILDDKIKIIKKKLRDQIDTGMDFKVFDALDMDLADFSDYAKTASFFSDRKFVVIKNAHKASREVSDIIIAQTGASGDTSTVFVLLSEKARLNSRLSETVKKFGATEEIRKPLARDVKRWLLERMEIDQVRMSEQALHLLLENTDHDISVLVKEYEKLYTFVLSDKQKTISEKDVERLVAGNVHYLMFDLIDFIGKRDKANTLRCLQRLFMDNESLIGAVTLTYRMFKSMLYIQNGAEDKAKQYIAKSANMRPEIVSMVLRKHKSYCAHYSAQQIMHAFAILHELNMSLRTASKAHKLSAVKHITGLIDMD
jgi:DNA polymerase III subunit delta